MYACGELSYWQRRLYNYYSPSCDDLLNLSYFIQHLHLSLRVAVANYRHKRPKKNLRQNVGRGDVILAEAGFNPDVAIRLLGWMQIQ